MQWIIAIFGVVIVALIAALLGFVHWRPDIACTVDEVTSTCFTRWAGATSGWVGAAAAAMTLFVLQWQHREEERARYRQKLKDYRTTWKTLYDCLVELKIVLEELDSNIPDIYAAGAPNSYNLDFFLEDFDSRIDMLKSKIIGYYGKINPIGAQFDEHFENVRNVLNNKNQRTEMDKNAISNLKNTIKNYIAQIELRCINISNYNPDSQTDRL